MSTKKSNKENDNETNYDSDDGSLGLLLDQLFSGDWISSASGGSIDYDEPFGAAGDHYPPDPDETPV